MGDYGAMCPVFRPTREEFEQPFSEYVRKVFRKHPDLPMFKVVPPRGWKPRRTPFPDLRKVQINVPIRQHVFGTKGAYRCVFVEQKPMSVAEFKLATEEEAARLRGGSHAAAVTSSEASASCGTGGNVRYSSRTTSSRHNRPPPEHESSPTHHRGSLDGEGAADGGGDVVDADMERAFWSNVTLNPPMYGADTPTSFFDEKLPYGWNLQHLGDLLQNHPKIRSVPGVTTPMTYFGMWRSFFGWHKEDADLYSVNFLHWGAPKVWYGVAPSAKHKFGRMAQSMFPELHRACPAFVRHKDIMLSPSCLKTYGVPLMRACQRANEFVVLNAAAYHAGFNSGFNCAEAVNFGLKEWIPVGKEAVPCRCSALKDGVRISMKLFDPKWVDPYETPQQSSEDENESEEEEEVSAPKRRRSGGGGGQKAAPAAKKARSGAKAKPAVPQKKKKAKTKEASVDSSDDDDEEEEEEQLQGGKPQRERKPTSKAAAAAAEKAATVPPRGGSRALVTSGAVVKAAAAAAGRDKKVIAAAAVKKAITKSRGGTKTPTMKATVAATKEKAPSAASSRALGRLRREAATALATAPTATKMAAPAGVGRRRKAEEQSQKAQGAVTSEAVPIEMMAPETVGPCEGRVGRPRRATAAAVAAASASVASAANATVATRKHSRMSASAVVTVAAPQAAVNATAVDEAATAAGPQTTGTRRCRSLRAQPADGIVVVERDTATMGPAVVADNRGCGGRTSSREATDAKIPTTGEPSPPLPAAQPTDPSPPSVLAAELMAEGRVVITAVKPRSAIEAAAMALKARCNALSHEQVVGPPMAIVGDFDAPSSRRLGAMATTTAAVASTEKRFFFLVQRLAQPAPTPGNVLLRWLKEGRDGLFRPVEGSVWEEPAGALLPVRAQAIIASRAADADVNTDSDGDSSGADGAGSSSPSHSAAAPASAAGAMTYEVESWRLVTPREQIIDVVLRRE